MVTIVNLCKTKIVGSEEEVKLNVVKKGNSMVRTWMLSVFTNI